MVTNSNGFEAVTLPCVVGTPNAAPDRVRIYTVEAPADLVGTFFAESAFNIESGFQRQLDRKRSQAIARLMLQDRPNVHGGLLAYADEDQVEYESSRGRNNLTIHSPLRLIDGQHRADACSIASAQGADYTETVRVITGATREELAIWYLRTNVEARKVPPANVIWDVARMHGTVMRRKSWIARLAVEMSKMEPFKIDDIPMVSWTPGDNGAIPAASLYRATDVLLPAELNAEGKEPEAIKFAHKVWSTYAELSGDVWGDLSPTEIGKFNPSDAYSFTAMMAYAWLCKATYDPTDPDKGLEVAEKAFAGAGLPLKLPTDIGSGEKASVAIAAYAAGKAGLQIERLQAKAA